MERAELVVRREYSKGDQRISLIVRVVSGEEIHGLMYRYETWVNYAEDESSRIDSGSVYDLARKFFTKLIDLSEEGWKRESVSDGEGKLKEHARFFDPDTL